MGILEILSQLLQFIREVIWPFWIVAEPNRAVKYRFGRHIAILEPGGYFAWPWAEEIRITNCAEDTIDIANLSITTEDGVQATLSYNAKLYVSDPLKFQTKIRQEIDSKKADTMPSAIHAECATTVARMLRKQAWESIYKSQNEIAGKITSALTTKLSNWGITVAGGNITNCANAVPLAIINVE
jgi:regulator of protease activity HflC (stomatin/prohibitin superfamily)